MTRESPAQQRGFFIDDAASGALLFDVDGTGAAAAVQFAQLNAGLALTHLDFLVV
jgi:Ca2+-binding RTX toxin-like protein